MAEACSEIDNLVAHATDVALDQPRRLVAQLGFCACGFVTGLRLYFDTVLRLYFDAGLRLYFWGGRCACDVECGGVEGTGGERDVISQQLRALQIER